MGLKFDSVFNNKDSKTFVAPRALKKKLNVLAPKGYQYELLNGTTYQYTLRSKNNLDETSIIIKLKFPLEFEGVNINNIEELLEIIYRTQKPYEVDSLLQENPPTIISIGGSGPIKQTLYPYEEFPEQKPLEITIGKIPVNLEVKRVPYASLNEIKIVSEKNQLFVLEIIINEDNNKMKFSMQLNDDFLKTLDDYFLQNDIIKEFYTKGIKFFNNSISPNKAQIETFYNTEEYLKALRKIQAIFNVKFSYPKLISRKDLFHTKILFESFVNKRMVANPENNKISFSFEREKYLDSNQNLKRGDRIGVVLPPIEINFELFDAKFDLLKYRVYRDIIFDHIQEDENDSIKLLFEQANEKSNCILYAQKSENISEEQLFELASTAVEINKIDFSKIK